MVFLCVKGTKFPDEFLFQCKCSDPVDTITTQATHLQNMRHKVRLQLSSLGELVSMVKGGTTTESSVMKKITPEMITRMDSLYTDILAQHKDTKLVNEADLFDRHWAAIRALIVDAFPNECTHKDGEEAAVTRLWELHENPEIDEDYRLHVYHCRAILDPHWRENEVLDVAKTALWFCGKALDRSKTIGECCNQNEKSKLTVKVALSSGPAPSGEPRMSYNDQRAIRNHVCERREVIKTLEDSELRDRVVQQCRGKVQLSTTGGAGGDNLRVTGIKRTGPIGADDAEEPKE